MYFQVISYSSVARAPSLTDHKFGEPSFGNMVTLTKTSKTFTKTEISQPNQGPLSCIQRLLPPRLSTTSKVPELTSVNNNIGGEFPDNTQEFRDQSHGRVNYEHIQNTSIYGATGTGHTSYPMVAGQHTMFSYPSAIHGVPQSMNSHMFHHVAQPLLPITQSTQSMAQPMMHPAQYMRHPMLPAQSMIRHPFSAQPMLNMVQPSQPMYAMAQPVQSNQSFNQFTPGLPVTSSVNSGTNISLQYNQSFPVPTSQYTQPFGSYYKNQ
ncbi:unnamed protein product [Owenia fusiformis]|uniref:Uncharacterized protein n=1 Tax=Owenia fusiformis TaxID=6347 RepID=A0A8S4NHR1_OWEFU|nr:unnamed protein product [Owenia fusiformis]